ncbi:DUF192 domain-containing protein [Pikeienuella piscinae]|uniref:DUF192 domain-containing protein n=1 Tax=Pikeienuella piscinae TaxID=2748098 RepID=A0A7M3T6N4_9RHOB|nr:DUF192 domain-containing protein [Pikeienuella piscinae]QIE57665.1 DUF192 domain-containing protein [Pikeienuella piscinae]
MLRQAGRGGETVLIVIARAVILALAVLAATSVRADTAPCAPETITIRADDGVAEFAVEIADTSASRAKGLMFREEMPADAGMLFVYDDADQVAFWMKNTPLSLDIIFFNRHGVICSITEAATPFSTDRIPSGCAAQTVLELNAGVAAARGLKRGAPARHPAIMDPVWACE